MIFSFSRGHKIIYLRGRWIYIDTREIFDDSRRCARCGENPDINGHDACIGALDHVSAACCGHGQIESYSVNR